MMEVVVTTGAIGHAKLQSNHHHQQTNAQFFEYSTVIYFICIIMRVMTKAGQKSQITEFTEAVNFNICH